VENSISGQTQRIHLYGSYKIADEMQNNDRLATMCRNTVAKAMRDLGMKSRVRNKFTPTTTITDPTKQPATNLL